MIKLICEYLSAWCIWVYVPVMSRTRFRVNPDSLVAWKSRNSLFEKKRKIWSLNRCNWTGTNNHLVHKRTLNHLAKMAKWLSWNVYVTWQEYTVI